MEIKKLRSLTNEELFQYLYPPMGFWERNLPWVFIIILLCFGISTHGSSMHPALCGFYVLSIIFFYHLLDYSLSIKRELRAVSKMQVMLMETQTIRLNGDNINLKNISIFIESTSNNIEKIAKALKIEYEEKTIFEIQREKDGEDNGRPH